MKKAALTLAFGNGAAKLLGLAREVLFAAWFGTSEIAAAFRIAQSLIIISIHSLVGDTVAGSMLPLYQRYRKESEDKARALLFIVLLQGLFMGTIIGAGMFFLSEQIVALLAPGASFATKHLAGQMVRVMAVVAPIYIVSNTLAYLESAHGKYTTLSSRTSLANIGIILAGAVANMFHQPIALAVGFVLVYSTFLAVILVDFARTGLLKFILGSIARPLHPIFVQFEVKTLSLVGMLILAQSNVVGERIVASWLGTSVIPGLDYARFLSDTLTVMLAVPIGIVTMATHGNSSEERLREHSRKTGSFLLAITIPVSVLVFSASTEIVQIIYARGAFNAHSVAITSEILRGSAIGIFATVTSYLLVKSLNTALRNRETFYLTLAAAAVNVAFNLLFFRLLGPSVLGIGNALYGIVLLCGAITLLELWRSLASLLLPSIVFGGGVGFLLIGVTFTHVALLACCIKTAMVFAAWVLYYFVSPPLRRSLAPVMNHFPQMRSRILRMLGIA